MDLKDYERVKFALAEILRSAALRSRKDGRDDSPVFRDLFARLAEDRFNLVVVGRFNRGKTSLMNALLGTTRLPVGIVPLTSVITTVSYGSEEEASIEYHGRSIPQRVRLDDLAEYVTERGNPGNARGVATARIRLPAALLRRGFHFIDTPGIGSAITENTRTTREFLPEADAVLVVTSYDSPLSEDEIEVIEALHRYGRRLFVIVNKEDLATAGERPEVLEHIRSCIHSAGISTPEVLSVSTREGFADGIAGLERYLTRFLIEEKQTEFIRVMCERVQDMLDAYPGDESERRNLRALSTAAGVRETRAQPVSQTQDGRATMFSICPICAQATQAVVSFLCEYQFELVRSQETRANFAEAGGFCRLHMWQYDALADPRGACVALSAVLERTAEKLRGIAMGTPPEQWSARATALVATTDRCPACNARERSERDALANAASAMDADPESARVTFCLEHFRSVLEGARDGRAGARLIEMQAGASENLAEDMRRYVIKFDGVRRYLIDAQERDANLRGLTLLAGSRGFNGVTGER